MGSECEAARDKFAQRARVRRKRKQRSDGFARAGKEKGGGGGLSLSLSLCFSRGGRVEGRRRDEREVVCGVDRGVEGGRRSPATPARA